MKNRYFLLIIFMLTFFSIELKAQDIYYWSAGKKHSLMIDKKSVSIKIIETQGFENTIQNFKTNNKLLASSKNNASNLLMIRATNDINKSNIRSDTNISNNMIAYGLRFRKDDLPMYLNGEILLQLKPNVNIKVLLNIIKGSYSSFQVSNHNIFKIDIKNWDNVIDISNTIYESGLVNYCHPNFVTSIERYQANPLDPLFVNQYYLNQLNNIDINAPEAWGISKGIKSVKVAVIDDGVESHEDLSFNLLPGYTPADPNGYGAPVHPLPPSNMYSIGHGQACAGIIGAAHNNIGMRGIAPCTQILPVNIFNNWYIDHDNFGNSFVNFGEQIQDLRNAIDWAWDNGQAEVISNSWGFTSRDANFDDITFAINRARALGRGGLGSVIVFASGNSHQRFTGITFPASVNGVVTVGAIDKNGSIWNYSSRGSQMDLVAPSGNVNLLGDVVTLDRMGANGYESGNYTNRFGGTSAACPQVSGVAALMLSVNPYLTENQVRGILQETATDMGVHGFDHTYGYGRLNASAAISSALPIISGPSTVCNGQTGFALNNMPVGTTLTWSSSNPNGLSINPTTGTATRQNNFTGHVTLTATISSGCGGTNTGKTVWVGEAQIYDILYSSMSVQPHTLVPLTILMYPGGYMGGHTHRFEITGPNGYSVTQYGNFNHALSFPAVGLYDVKVYTQNSCGWSTSYYPLSFWCTTSGNYFSVYPNPADELLNIAEGDLQASAGATEQMIASEQEVYSSATLYDLSGKPVRTTSPAKGKMNVQDLKQGSYYLQIVYGDKSESHHVLIKRQ